MLAPEQDDDCGLAQGWLYMCFGWRQVVTPITRIMFMVQQRSIVNQRLQLRLQVDYETGPCGGIYIQQRVFPQQRIKELGLDLRYGAQAMGYYQCTRLSADQPVSPVRFDLILALFICSGYLDARSDETWNMAILLRFSHIRTSLGCSGYNPYVFSESSSSRVWCS